MNSKIQRISKGEKRKINCGENYSIINIRLNLKTRFVREKKKNGIISGMSWCNAEADLGLLQDPRWSAL